jgi:outer membrane receptor protein involved in Fe transport
MQPVLRSRCLWLALAVGAPLTLSAQDSTHVHTARPGTRSDSAARLKPVTIVAAPAERSEPVAATSIDATTIRLTPAATPYDLLRQAAGLEVHQQGQGPGFGSDVSLRGFSSDHATDIALWVDGVPINEPVNGHAEGYNDFSVLFPGGIRDIDVIHGPTNALFGNFSMAGTVNVRTLDRLNGSELDVTGGSYGRADVMGMTGFDHGARGGGVIGARYVQEDGFRPNSHYDIMQGHARVEHDLNSSVAIDAGAELYGTNWNSPGFLGEDEFARHEYDIVSNPTDGGYKRRAQERVSLRVLGSNYLWRTTVYGTEGRWQLFLTIPPAGGKFEGSGSQTEEEDSRAGAGATSAITWTLDRAEITTGVETRWDRSNYENYFTTARRRDSTAADVLGAQTSGAPFVQSSFQLTDRLRADVGARYDVLSTSSTPKDSSTISATHGVFSPKLGLIERLSSSFSTYVNASRGFRSTDGLIIDPTLAPITAWAYEGGVKFDRAGASASAALFRMDVSNEQTFNPVTLVATNGGSSRRQGLELEWRVPFASQTAALSGEWTFNDARYRSSTIVTDDGDAVVLNGLRVYNTSKYVGTSALDIAPIGQPWRIRVAGNWVGPYSPFDEPGTVLGAYGLAHVSGAWTFNRTEVEAGVRNVFDRAYPELVAGGVVSPGEPRTVFVSMRVKP